MAQTLERWVKSDAWDDAEPRDLRVPLELLRCFVRKDDVALTNAEVSILLALTIKFKIQLTTDDLSAVARNTEGNSSNTEKNIHKDSIKDDNISQHLLFNGDKLAYLQKFENFLMSSLHKLMTGSLSVISGCPLLSSLSGPTTKSSSTTAPANISNMDDRTGSSAIFQNIPAELHMLLLSSCFGGDGGTVGVSTDASSSSSVSVWMTEVERVLRDAGYLISLPSTCPSIPQLLSDANKYANTDEDQSDISHQDRKKNLTLSYYVELDAILFHHQLVEAKQSKLKQANDHERIEKSVSYESLQGTMSRTKSHWEALTTNRLGRVNQFLFFLQRIVGDEWATSLYLSRQSRYEKRADLLRSIMNELHKTRTQWLKSVVEDRQILLHSYEEMIAYLKSAEDTDKALVCDRTKNTSNTINLFEKEMLRIFGTFQESIKHLGNFLEASSDTEWSFDSKLNEYSNKLNMNKKLLQDGMDFIFYLLHNLWLKMNE